MRKIIFAVIAILTIIGCNTTKIATLKELKGIYVRHGGSEKIEFKSDGTFILYNLLQDCSVFVEQCEIASKGKWNLKSNDVLELTSENYYLKQKGYDYELKKENKLSQDSLYIKIIFPENYEPNVKMFFLFVNYESEKIIETENKILVIPKSEYLWSKSSHLTSINRIYFSIKAKVPKITMYRSRIFFDIFEEDIDTDETNYLTITLPYFDRCFLEFKPVKDLIYIKDDRHLFWKSDIWKRLE